MATSIPFTWEHRYRGVVVGEIDANVYVEIHGEDPYLRITFGILGRPDEIEVYGKQREAVIHYLNSNPGLSRDIAEAVHDERLGQVSYDREMARAG